MLVANPDLDSYFFVELPWYLRSAKHLENCCTDLDISLGGVDPSWKDQPVEVEGMSMLCNIYIYMGNKYQMENNMNMRYKHQGIKIIQNRQINQTTAGNLFDFSMPIQLFQFVVGCRTVGFAARVSVFDLLNKPWCFRNLLLKSYLFSPKGLCIWLAEPRPGLCFSLLLQLGATEKKDQL